MAAGVAKPGRANSGNYIPYCRSYHSAGFFVYILLLVVVIVLVWLADDTISLFNAAVGVTIAVAICIGLMFVHWYWFIKGVIPECRLGHSM